MSVLLGVAIWFGASIPVSLIVCRVIRGRCHDSETCGYCRQPEDW